MNEQSLIFTHAIAYMLKVLKNGNDVTLLKNEFNQIKHGDYEGFMSSIGVPASPTVIYADPNAPIPDFFKLIWASSSAREFYNRCYSIYGNIIDADFNNDTYIKLAAFEIRIRMHANLVGIVTKISATESVRLEKVIDELSEVKQINAVDTEILHDGRRFLNKVKHSEDTAWKNDIINFNNAFETLNKYSIRIF